MSLSSLESVFLHAIARRQARLCREAESFAIAKSPIRYEPSEAARAVTAKANAATALGLCAHGKVPRLVAEKMNMPCLACNRCA